MTGNYNMLSWISFLDWKRGGVESLVLKNIGEGKKTISGKVRDLNRVYSLETRTIIILIS